MQATSSIVASDSMLRLAAEQPKLLTDSLHLVDKQPRRRSTLTATTACSSSSLSSCCSSSTSSSDSDDHDDDFPKNMQDARHLSSGKNGGGGRRDSLTHPLTFLNVLHTTQAAVTTTTTTDSMKKNSTTTLQEILANLTEIAFDSDEEEASSDGDDDDDISVLSAISGLDVASEHFRLPPRRDVHSKKKGPHHASSSIAETFSVSFGSVNVRYYERILTDNPSCADGRAIGLGWNVQEVRDYSTVDDWEDTRQGKRRLNKLQLSKKKRARVLSMQGYSEKEMDQMAHVIFKSRHQRRATLASLGTQEIEELVESARHNVQRFLFLKKKDNNHVKNAKNDTLISI